MEVVLLWLDDLDDLIFAGLLTAERLRPSCLVVGLLAAVTLHYASLWNASLGIVVTLANVSLASVVAWSLVSLVSFRLDRRVARLSQTA